MINLQCLMDNNIKERASGRIVQVYVRRVDKKTYLMNLPEYFNSQQLKMIISAKLHINHLSLLLFYKGEQLKQSVHIVQKSIIHAINLQKVDLPIIKVHFKSLQNKQGHHLITDSQSTIKEAIREHFHNISIMKTYDDIIFEYSGRKININNNFKQQYIQNNAQIQYIKYKPCFKAKPSLKFAQIIPSKLYRQDIAGQYKKKEIMIKEQIDKNIKMESNPQLSNPNIMYEINKKINQHHSVHTIQDLTQNNLLTDVVFDKLQALQKQDREEILKLNLSKVKKQKQANLQLQIISNILTGQQPQQSQKGVAFQNVYLNNQDESKMNVLLIYQEQFSLNPIKQFNLVQTFNRNNK